MSAGRALTGEQSDALLDILTHWATHTEIEAFKSPSAVTRYGYPFGRTTKLPAKLGGSRASTPASSAPSTPRVRTPVSFFWARDDRKKGGDNAAQDTDENEGEGEAVESSSPLLQMLLTKLVLPFPRVKDLPGDFWNTKVQGILARFGEADLSESYDKGAMGTRKTLATGASSVFEMLVRGVLSGVEDARANMGEAEGESSINRLMNDYDSSKAEDLERAWDDCVQQWAYGDLLDQIFDHLSNTEDLEGHSPAVKALMDYIIIHLATLAHEIFVLSPEGQYLVKLIESINNLVPYKLMAQTLRVGNAAIMINGMVRLLLTKLSVTSITNWVGLTANADDGMNMLQRIIWVVLTFDGSEFRKSAERVEKMKVDDEDKPTEDMLQAIRQHVNESREKHESIRSLSWEQSQSIIVAILDAEDPHLVSSLTKGQHAQCMAYYSALLSARDRENIISVLCRQPPDLFTQIIKDAIAAYDPMIRSVHTRVDLRDHLESLQQFISDFIQASEPKRGSYHNNNNNNQDNTKTSNSNNDITKTGEEEERMASVEDYVLLLRKNKGLPYKWLHAVAKGCPDVWSELKVWAKAVAAEFRQRAVASRDSENSSDGEGPLKDMRGCLDDLFTSLDPDAQEDVLAAIDAHAIYLSKLNLQSRQRLQKILSRSTSPLSADMTLAGAKSVGPGAYLSRWQDLVDNMRITPREPHGPVRRGRDVKYITTMGKLGVGGKRLSARSPGAETAELEAPDVSVVVGALGERFRGMVREKVGDGRR